MKRLKFILFALLLTLCRPAWGQVDIDTLMAVAKDGVDKVVKYQAKDSVAMDLKTRKAFLFTDGSIDYDIFEVREHSIEYAISGCRYVDMFEAWGIRRLCKIFCETDTRSYARLTRHVEFVRHSDLSDGPSCHDEIIERNHRKRDAS